MIKDVIIGEIGRQREGRWAVVAGPFRSVQRPGRRVVRELSGGGDPAQGRCALVKGAILATRLLEPEECWL
jgi:hypothetical protein